MPVSSWNPFFHQWMTQHGYIPGRQPRDSYLLMRMQAGLYTFMCPRTLKCKIDPEVQRKRDRPHIRGKGKLSPPPHSTQKLQNIREFYCLSGHFEGIFLKVERQEDRTYFSSLLAWFVTFTSYRYMICTHPFWPSLCSLQMLKKALPKLPSTPHH